MFYLESPPISLKKTPEVEVAGSTTRFFDWAPITTTRFGTKWTHLEKRLPVASYLEQARHKSYICGLTFFLSVSLRDMGLLDFMLNTKCDKWYNYYNFIIIIIINIII